MMPQGYRVRAVASGLKPSGNLDLGILVSDVPAAAAGVFTANKVKAAPVPWSQDVVEGGAARALVANAGNANACTGAQGKADTAEMASLGAQLAGCDDKHVLVASTGIIGVPMDMSAVRRGFDQLASAQDDPVAFAAAIMTTDTVPKTASARAGNATVWGVAKGAGMIAPEMATMLAFIVTDAEVPADLLQRLVSETLETSFNAISVDGCMSTNDCVLALANGLAGPVQDHEIAMAFADVAGSLARQIVADGEGATKVVQIIVDEASSHAEARAAAVAIADSVLLRCALHGADPNWGRVLAALGTADATFDPDRVDVWIGSEQLCAGGARGPGDLTKAAAAMKEREIVIQVNLHAGPASATRWTNDLSAEYVRINADYTT